MTNLQICIDNLVSCEKARPKHHAVFNGLVSHAKKQARIWPSVQRLAKILHMGVETVRQALKDLIAWGFIKRYIKSRPGGGRGMTVYLIVGLRFSEARKSKSQNAEKGRAKHQKSRTSYKEKEKPLKGFSPSENRKGGPSPKVASPAPAADTKEKLWQEVEAALGPDPFASMVWRSTA